jgi:tetratricopeptide (TPR) repeat protein
MPDPGHPTHRELRGVLLDEVGQERGLQIADHLAAGCEECALAMLAELGSLLYGPDEFFGGSAADSNDSENLDVYDQAIDHAVRSSLRIARRTRREQDRIPAALSLLHERGSDAFLGDVPRRLGGIAGLEALLARSREIRDGGPGRDEAAESMRLAGAAVVWADGLPARRYGLRQVRDLQCRAWLELAAASGAAGKTAAARKALTEAARSFLDGTRDAALEVGLLEAQAALAAGSHPAGRALVSRGVASGSAGQLEEAARLIEQGLALLDREREPALVLAAVHSLLHILVELGRFRETCALLFEYRPAFQAVYRGAGRPH